MQATIQTKLWKLTDDARGHMNIIEFRNYLFCLMFYAYLSEQVKKKRNKGYTIKKKYLFSSMVDNVEHGIWNNELLKTAFVEFNNSIEGTESAEALYDIFDDVDFSSTNLGRTEANRSLVISKIILGLKDIDFSDSRVSGEIFEYLIASFSAASGKNTADIYSPVQVSKLLAQLVGNSSNEINGVYDPAMGSASSLLQVGSKVKVKNYFGTELNKSTFNLARMNMIIHGVKFNKLNLRNANTLDDDQFKDKKFDAVVSIPPFSVNWEPVDDVRFNEYGKLAPRSKADYAFIEDMLYHLDEKGTMAVVLPHGVLFRGAAEGVIRKYIIDKQKSLDAVIGLPNNIFYGTMLATVVLVFKKEKNHDDILFVDAFNDFEKTKKNNVITDDGIDRIIDAYNKRENIAKYAKAVSYDDIIKNDYNLNINRYIDTYEDVEVNIEQVERDLKRTKTRIENLDIKILGLLNKL
ncbi:type I restriction-modification system subunit M [Periweissella cryptocerci]|uniref:site-specific DNA-methyltransferase (adenine-specific) n=1 Tax=Periweissella cryptocerci TaxID=2506420 RepID=A0A4P6YST3_9LACO|nr:type I restriction-modification system subunit M [Periweissella cryptocerci]QBO35784.1 type I restriction-modification system subunit M [Periweissella cryptocerci]